MSPPVVEVVTLPIGEKLKADPSLIKTFAKRLFDQEGCKKVSYGPLVEDPNQALLFIVWENIEAHQKYIAQPYYASSVGDELVTLLSGNPSFIHVPFDPVKNWDSLKGPISEYTLFKPKEGVPNAREELENVTKDILKLADEHPKCHGTHYAASVEDKDELVLFLSWPTVEAHVDEYRTQDAFKPFVEILQRVASKVSIVHSKITHIH